MMKSPFILILLLFSFTALKAGENQFVLKETVYTRTNCLSFDDLLINGNGMDTVIQISSNRFYSNYELSQLLRKQYAKEAVLIGKGVLIEWIDQTSGMDDIKNYLSNSYPGIEIQNIDFSEIKLPDEFKIRKMYSEFQNSSIKLTVEYLYFSGNNGITDESQFELKYNGNLLQQNKGILENTQEGFYLENIDKTTADLIYKKGDIHITMKVKIRRKLEDRYYLVENNISRKIFRVKLKE